MATRRALAAGGCFLELYRQVPDAVRDALAYVLRQVACVRSVARATRSSPFRLVDVYEVQVQSAVSKVGQVGCFFCQDHRIGVATEAERVVFHAEGRIKLRRVFLDQQAEILAAMADVAPGTIAFGDGTVQILLVLNLICKGAESLIITHLDGFVVTCCAKSHFIFLQKELDARSMRRMAFKTPADIIDNAVLIRRVFGDFLDVFVASIAEERCEVLNESRIATPVWIVTADTVILGWLVDELVFLQLTLSYCVAGKTQLTVLANQQVLMVGAMRFVTDCTFTDGHRPM